VEGGLESRCRIQRETVDKPDAVRAGQAGARMMTVSARSAATRRSMFAVARVGRGSARTAAVQ
jgi:hypothetical protein